MLQDRIEVAGSTGRIGRLTDAASFDHQRLLEALVDRPQGRTVAKMPFAEDASPVPGRSQHLGQRHLIRVHHCPAQIRVDHARAVVVPASEQAGTRRRADGRNIEILDPDTFTCESIDIRRLDLGVTVNAQVAIALVVGDDQENVGAARVLRSLAPRRSAVSRVQAKAKALTP